MATPNQSGDAKPRATKSGSRATEHEGLHVHDHTTSASAHFALGKILQRGIYLCQAPQSHRVV